MRRLLVMFLVLCASPVFGQEAKVPTTIRKVVMKSDGSTFNAHFFDHDKYRQKMQSFKFSKAYKPLTASWPAGDKAFDWGKGLTYPMYGNDQFGDCFYADIAHHDQTLTGARGLQSSFQLGTFSTSGTGILNRYRILSGGDNGLYDAQVQQEWKNRYIADVKDAKAFDFFYVDTTSPSVLGAAMREMGGISFTFTVADNWMDGFKTGMVWDAKTYNRNNNGHAVHLCGVDDRGFYKLITWGTHVWLTPEGLNVCNPSGFIACSTRWFDAKGYAPTGRHITDLSAIVVAAGGHAFPQSIISQFPPKVDPPVNIPVITSPLFANGVLGQPFQYQIVASGSPTAYSAKLPAPLSVSASGLISGTPTTAGTFQVPMTATNSSGTGSATLVIAIGEWPQPTGDSITITRVIGGKTTTETYHLLPSGMRAVPADAEIMPAGTRDAMKKLLESFQIPKIEAPKGKPLPKEAGKQSLVFPHYNDVIRQVKYEKRGLPFVCFVGIEPRDVPGATVAHSASIYRGTTVATNLIAVSRDGWNQTCISASSTDDEIRRTAGL